MKSEEVEFLSQLVSSLKDAELRLGEAYKKLDYVEFDRIKAFIIQIQKRIIGAIR